MQRSACVGELYVYAGIRDDPCEREYDLCVVDFRGERECGELFVDGGGDVQHDVAYGSVEPGGDRL